MLSISLNFLKLSRFLSIHELHPSFSSLSSKKKQPFFSPSLLSNPYPLTLPTPLFPQRTILGHANRLSSRVNSRLLAAPNAVKFPSSSSASSSSSEQLPLAPFDASQHRSPAPPDPALPSFSNDLPNEQIAALLRRTTHPSSLLSLADVLLRRLGDFSKAARPFELSFAQAAHDALLPHLPLLPMAHLAKLLRAFLVLDFAPSLQFIHAMQRALIARPSRFEVFYASDILALFLDIANNPSPTYQANSESSNSNITHPSESQLSSSSSLLSSSSSSLLDSSSLLSSSSSSSSSSSTLSPLLLPEFVLFLACAISPAATSLSYKAATNILHCIAALGVNSTEITACLLSRLNYLARSAQINLAPTPREICTVVQALLRMPHFRIRPDGISSLLSCAHAQLPHFSAKQTSILCHSLPKLHSPALDPRFLRALVAHALSTLDDFNAQDIVLFINSIYRLNSLISFSSSSSNTSSSSSSNNVIIPLLSPEDFHPLLSRLQQLAPTFNALNLPHLLTALAKLLPFPPPPSLVHALSDRCLALLPSFSTSSLATAIAAFAKIAPADLLRPLFRAFEVASLRVIADFNAPDIASYLAGLAKFCPGHSPSAALLSSLESAVAVLADELNPKGLAMVFSAFSAFSHHGKFVPSRAVAPLCAHAGAQIARFDCEDVLLLVRALGRLCACYSHPNGSLLALLEKLLAHAVDLPASPKYAALMLRNLGLLDFHLPQNRFVAQWSPQIQMMALSQVLDFSHEDLRLALDALASFQPADQNPALRSALEMRVKDAPAHPTPDSIDDMYQ